MGNKIAWLGLALLLAAPIILSVPYIEAVGAIILLIGVLLIILDK